MGNSFETFKLEKVSATGKGIRKENVLASPANEFERSDKNKESQEGSNEGINLSISILHDKSREEDEEEWLNHFESKHIEINQNSLDDEESSDIAEKISVLTLLLDNLTIETKDKTRKMDFSEISHIKPVPSSSTPLQNVNIENFIRVKSRIDSKHELRKQESHLDLQRLSNQLVLSKLQQKFKTRLKLKEDSSFFSSSSSSSDYQVDLLKKRKLQFNNSLLSLEKEFQNKKMIINKFQSNYMNFMKDFYTENNLYQNFTNEIREKFQNNLASRPSTK
jgi:hypothetical protein